MNFFQSNFCKLWDIGSGNLFSRYLLSFLKKNQASRIAIYIMQHGFSILLLSFLCSFTYDILKGKKGCFLMKLLSFFNKLRVGTQEMPCIIQIFENLFSDILRYPVQFGSLLHSPETLSREVLSIYDSSVI